MSEQPPFYINLNGTLTDISVPRVMGILNVTPDSFYAASRQQSEEAIAKRTRFRPTRRCAAWPGRSTYCAAPRPMPL